MPLVDAQFEELRQYWAGLKERADSLIDERQSYLDFFDLLPEPSLITDRSANILSANRAASEALSISPGWRARQPLASYLNYGCRRDFRTKLSAFLLGQPSPEWHVRAQEGNSAFAVTVRAMASGRELSWVFHRE